MLSFLTKVKEGFQWGFVCHTRWLWLLESQTEIERKMCYRWFWRSINLGHLRDFRF